MATAARVLERTDRVPVAAAVYCRISDDKSGERAGVERQRADCIALAARRGWPVARTYVDNDVSAYSGRNRPEYRRLLADLRSGAVDAVLAWHPDRLHRSPVELEEFIAVVEAASVPVETVTAGQADLSTPTGRAVARTVGAWARFESEHKAERIRRKHEELAREGKGKGGGTRPFGFEDDRVTIREPEAVLIREAAQRVVLGASLRGICADWTARGVRTPTGAEWRSTSLRRMLASGRIAGLREHHGVVVAEAVWPAIIDRATHERLQVILKDPRRLRRVSGAAPRSYLLTGGLARCGLCGGPLIARPRDDGKRCYVCASGPNFGGCGRLKVLAEPLEDLVAEAIASAVDSPALVERLRAGGDDDRAQLAAELRADEEALEELTADHYVNRVIDRRSFLASKSALDDRITRTRRELSQRAGAAALGDLPSGGDAMREAWAASDFAWRRTVVTTLLERAEVGPAVRGRARFDPDRVSLTWRA